MYVGTLNSDVARDPEADFGCPAIARKLRESGKAVSLVAAIVDGTAQFNSAPIRKDEHAEGTG